MTAIDDLFVRARAAHQAGRPGEAEPGYREVVRAEPTHVAAWYLLGVACHALGKLDDSVEALRKALRLRPDHVEAWNHLGIVLALREDPEGAVDGFRQALRLRPRFVEARKNLAIALDRQGKLDEAAASYRETLRLQPDLDDVSRSLGIVLRKQGKWAEAEAAVRQALRSQPGAAQLHNDLGTLLEKQARREEAMECYREAIRLQPDLAGAYSNLGAALGHLGRLDEALECARQAVRLKPDYAGGWNNLGVLVEKQEDWSGALECYHKAIRFEDGFVEALYNLGSVLTKLGRLDEAEARCREAIASRPDSAEAYHNLGVVYAEQNKIPEAAASYQQAIALKPEFVDPYVNLSSVLGKGGRLDEGEACCRQAIRLDPGRAEAYSNLGFVLVEQGKIAEAVACYREALRLKPDSRTMLSSFLFSLNYDPAADPGTLLEEHRRWARVQEQVERLGPLADHDRDPRRRLRVGYVSPDLRAHPVAYFLEPILAHHDAAWVEAYCYAEVPAPDAMTARLQSLATAWRPTYGLTDAQLAEQVRRDRIDILVDLAGHTAHHRLAVFARRPAPVQVTYLGYPNTTGLSAIDYILTDAVADPPGGPPWSSEEPYRLPGGFCCFEPPPDAPEVSPLPALAAGTVTFGSLHKLSKLNAEVLDLWSDLLLAVPSARLLLYRNNLRGRRREEILDHFRGRGIDPERLDMRYVEKAPGGHLAVYGSIDIALDVFPWCGHTTACESLWMGVPMITLSGNRHAGRMTASVLSTLELTDWVAHSKEEYLERARQEASDLDSLARCRSGLRRRMRASPLCDGRTWTRDLESAYREMWRRWCASAEAEESSR